MKRKLARYAFLAFSFAVAVPASGQTKYYPYDVLNHPTEADLVTYGREARTVIVQILNLTRYNIRYTPSEPYSIDGVPVAAVKDMLDKNRETAKTFMFAPVGIPRLISGVPAQAFLLPGDPGYDENYVNNETRPYSMAFSWDDQAQFVKKSSVFWTVEGLDYPVCPTPGNCTWYKADVPIGLFMSRVEPPTEPLSGFLPILVDIVSMGAKMVKIVMNPVNPANWFKAFTATVELANDALFLANQQADMNNSKLYVSAYAIPEPHTVCYTNNSTEGCVPSSHYTDDAAEAQWGTANGGWAAARLMVTTHVLRGQIPWESWSAHETEDAGRLGALTVVMITIMTDDQYIAAKGTTLVQTGLLEPESPLGAQLTPDVRANIMQLRKLLEKHGAEGRDALWSAVQQLDHYERLALRSVFNSLMSGEPLTITQRQLLHKFIVDVRLVLNEK